MGEYNTNLQFWKNESINKVISRFKRAVYRSEVIKNFIEKSRFKKRRKNKAKLSKTKNR